MKKIKLDIINLTYSQTQSGAYALILGEVGGRRRLPIIIGGFEAQAIAIEIEKMSPNRPLTHDLFKSLTINFNIAVEEIIIYNLVDGIFFAKLVCNDGKKTVELDARTSDAIALALRYQCPIYTYEFILSSVGIMIEGNDFAFLENIETNVNSEDDSIDGLSKSSFKNFSMVELEEMLEKALDEENYEKAARIRDEISKRQ